MRMSSPALTVSIVFSPVIMIFPDEKRRNTILGSLIRQTSPGNASGSYSTLSGSMNTIVILTRFRGNPRLWEQTMLVIAAFGLSWQVIPASLNGLRTFCNAAVFSGSAETGNYNFAWWKDEYRGFRVLHMIYCTGNFPLVNLQPFLLPKMNFRSIASATDPDVTIFSIFHELFSFMFILPDWAEVPFIDKFSDVRTRGSAQQSPFF